MADSVSGNLAMLMRVVKRFGPLRDRFVFLGGAVTEFFITQPGGPGPRRTKDVDVVVDVVNLGEYSVTLREQLVALGFCEDTREGAPVCRWLLDDIIVDIMPVRGEILGFSAEWYPLAYETATPLSLPDGTVIRLVTPACFLATKLAAFNDRGRRDPMASHDLEDLLSVIDGRREIAADLAAAPPTVRAYVAERLSQFLARSDVEVLVAAQLMPDSDSQERLPLVLDRIRGLIAAAT